MRRSTRKTDPRGHPNGDVEGLAVAGKLVCVDEAGENLVESVPRGPDVHALLNAIEERLGERRKVALVEASGGGRGLAAREFGDDVVHALFECGVAGAPVHEGAGGEVMPEGMAAELDGGALPAAVGRGGGRQANV